MANTTTSGKTDANTTKEVVEIADNRIEALEGLLVCYRIGKHHTEKLLTKLDSAGKDWQARKKEWGIK